MRCPLSTTDRFIGVEIDFYLPYRHHLRQTLILSPFNARYVQQYLYDIPMARI